jgi:lactobin A/cerein 7B family class IIb bacteriocin|tara:strand:+ start:1819 stop:2013 length:195 start_codon:yes stop_codon:yes gene_type:complete
MKNLQNFGVQELSASEIREVDGGFVPLIIWGVYLSANAVAGIIGTCFLAGVAVGANVASDQATN